MAHAIALAATSIGGMAISAERVWPRVSRQRSAAAAVQAAFAAEARFTGECRFSSIRAGSSRRWVPRPVRTSRAISVRRGTS